MRRVLGTLTLVAVVVVAGCSAGTKNRSQDKQEPEGPGGQANLTPAGPGKIKPQNARIEWTGTKPGGKHEGGFKQFSGSITPARGDLTASTISLEIDTDSLYSDTPRLTGHLKSPDFFEVQKYPKANFVSRSIKESKADGATHSITGDLTLHGTTKSITFPAKATLADDVLTIESTFKFDRIEHGITYSPERVDKIVTVRVTAKVARK
jgi:polyisoprenoid-binding protein YceI